jgi:hypothetical protein
LNLNYLLQKFIRRLTIITAANIGICKSWADGSRVSTFVFQFGFISGRTLII